MKIIACESRHLAAIREIYNEAILNTTANWDYVPRTAEDIADWFAAKTLKSFPVIGMENENGVLMGVATYGAFREKSGYRYSVEHSVYVDKRFRGRGVGKTLLKELIATAVARDLHMMIGAIDALNPASIALHRSFGFTHCASIKQAGFKFDRWLDVEFYQLILKTPSNPLGELEAGP
jgi:phosphinothricin acetyltransferase